MTSLLGLINLQGKIPGSQTKQPAKQQVQISQLSFRGGWSWKLPAHLLKMTQAPARCLMLHRDVQRRADGSFKPALICRLSRLA